MTVFDWYRFFTWLAWGATAAIVALWGLRLTASASAGTARVWTSVRRGLARDGLTLAAIVATVATAGKPIIVAPNGDGSFLAVTQSC